MISKTQQRPARLVCVECQQVLPQSAQVPIVTLVVRHFWGVVMLLGMVVVPLLLMTLSPWIERVPRAPRSASREMSALR